MADEVWLQVGEVARMTGLTVRTLHHYDKLGLLVASGRSAGDYRLYSADDLRRLLAIQHLKSLGLALDEVAAALDSGDVDAADALARHIAAVRERIRSEQELLRRLQGLQAAAQAGWQEVVEVIALTERLRHAEPHVRFRAALKGPKVPLDELIAGLIADPEPGVREALTWAVAMRGEEATAAVADQLRHPDPGVRRQLAHVLAKLGDPAAVPVLVGALDDADDDVAAKAAQGLGQLGRNGAPGALEPLVARLGTGSHVTDEAVLTAVAGFGSAAVPSVVAALSDPVPRRRGRAAEALGMIGDPTAASPLVARLADDDDLEVRFEALVALGQLGGDEAEAAIEGCLHSPDDRLRLVATRLLSDRRRAVPPAP